MTHPARVGAVVLAAGAGSRFGGGKLLAPLAGRPVLQHVLDALAPIGLGEIVVVVGADPAGVAAGIDWRGERIVPNPHPDRGLASSLQLGVAALGMGRQAALIVLGDQPDVRAEVIRQLLEAETTARRPVLVPCYAEGGGRNPVLLRRSSWSQIDRLEGDRGLGDWLAAHPEEVLEVAVEGCNPDVDTPADLALLAWERQVLANGAQVERIREAPDGPDFYATTSAIFRADPDRTGDEVLDALLALARPTDTWLDVGAGAGRYALALARHVREVIALDPSATMLGDLRALAAEHGIDNVRTIAARWPLDAAGLAQVGEAPAGDVALIAHVGYDIATIGPFLDALEGSAGRACVAVLMEQSPAALAEPLWPPVHGEARIPLPALDAFVALLAARGREPAVRYVTVAEPGRVWEELEAFARRQTWVAPGSEKEARMLGTLRDLAIELPDGRWTIPQPPRRVGIVSWAPR